MGKEFFNTVTINEQCIIRSLCFIIEQIINMKLLQHLKCHLEISHHQTTFLMLNENV